MDGNLNGTDAREHLAHSPYLAIEAVEQLRPRAAYADRAAASPSPPRHAAPSRRQLFARPALRARTLTRAEARGSVRAAAGPASDAPPGSAPRVSPSASGAHGRHSPRPHPDPAGPRSLVAAPSSQDGRQCRSPSSPSGPTTPSCPSGESSPVRTGVRPTKRQEFGGHTAFVGTHGRRLDGQSDDWAADRQRPPVRAHTTAPVRGGGSSVLRVKRDQRFRIRVAQRMSEILTTALIPCRPRRQRRPASSPSRSMAAARPRLPRVAGAQADERGSVML